MSTRRFKIQVTRDNLWDVIKTMIDSRFMLEYNRDCISSREIRLAQAAALELDRFFKVLVRNQVNLYWYVRPYYNQVGEPYGFLWNNRKHGLDYFHSCPDTVPEYLSFTFGSMILFKVFVSKTAELIAA